MGNKLSIKVKIADREYPLSVSLDEEEVVRKAAKLINDNIQLFEKNYSVRDKQDLVAMTALQFATQVAKGKIGTSDDEDIIAALNDLRIKTSEYLSS